MLFSFNPFTMDKDPDADLLKRLRAGEPDAFTLLEMRHKRMVIGLAEALGVANEAEDVWQHVCLRVRQSKEEATLGAFIYKTAVHKCIDLKRKAARQKASLDSLARDAVATPQRNPEEDLLRQERQQLLEQALNSLPPAEREVIELIHIQGLKPQEVSRKLNKPPTTIYVCYSRARRKMREFLEAKYKS
ncbi:MAG: sigma-70 family RNA polymerase sigma factor [Acidobacteria bacterium]|nr:sigma-70 family RNA polymerase sigma factor [Acidobacteriota bacterium]